jgi:hypothetical protein
MGKTREFRQLLRREVGIMSREQVALEEFRIWFLISSGVAGVKFGRVGGGKSGGR